MASGIPPADPEMCNRGRRPRPKHIALCGSFGRSKMPTGRCRPVAPVKRRATPRGPAGREKVRFGNYEPGLHAPSRSDAAPAELRHENGGKMKKLPMASSSAPADEDLRL